MGNPDTGITIFLGILLLTAGALKLSIPRPFEHAIYRLLPDSLRPRRAIARAAAPVVGLCESAVGVGLISSPWLADSLFRVCVALSAFLYLGFVVVVLHAVRRGAACGCWSSLSDGTAGGAEVGRSLVLAALSLVALSAGVTSRSPGHWRWAVAPWAILCGLAVVAGVVIGGRILPDSQVARRGVDARLTTAQHRRHRDVERSRVASLAALLLGMITSQLGESPLPIEREVSPAVSKRLVAAARASRSVHAFSDWLGERDKHIDWDRVDVRTVTNATSEGTSVNTVEISLAAPTSFLVEVFMNLDRDTAVGDAVVISVVDGVSVVASAGEVISGEELEALFEGP